MICPICKGYGKLQGFYITANKEELPCPICKGSGELPSFIEYDPERGKRQRQRRVDRQMTLRAEAIATGIDPVILSEQERGLLRR